MNYDFEFPRQYEVHLIMRAKFHGSRVRPWARPYGQAMCTDALGDLPTIALFRVAPVHPGTPRNEILQENWEQLSDS